MFAPPPPFGLCNHHFRNQVLEVVNVIFCSLVSALPPPVPPKFKAPFKPILRLFTSDVLLHILSTILSRTAASRSRSWSEAQFERVSKDVDTLLLLPLSRVHHSFIHLFFFCFIFLFFVFSFFYIITFFSWSLYFQCAYKDQFSLRWYLHRKAHMCSTFSVGNFSNISVETHKNLCLYKYLHLTFLLSFFLMPSMFLQRWVRQDIKLMDF